MTFDPASLNKYLNNPLGLLNIPNFQIYQLSFFTILLFFLIGLRITLSVVGRKYSALRLFLGPIFLVLLVSYNYYNSYLVSISLNIATIFRNEALTIPFFLFLGLALGHRLARNDRVFLKKGKPHYRSSITISLVWAISFLLKMGVITFIPSIFSVLGITISAILDLTTGLILGEALKIHGIYKREYAGGYSVPM